MNEKFLTEKEWMKKVADNNGCYEIRCSPHIKYENTRIYSGTCPFKDECNLGNHCSINGLQWSMFKMKKLIKRNKLKEILK